jgi:hypothetical protein
MAIGFPARFIESRTYHLQRDELVAAAKSALEDLKRDRGWSYSVASGGEIRASVPFGGGTWGENFKVRFLSGGVIEVESKCKVVRLPPVVDYGKNRRNVETFFELVEHGIGEHAVPKPQWGLFRGCLSLIFPVTLLIATVSLYALTFFILFVKVKIPGSWASAISFAVLILCALIMARLFRDR